MHNTCVSSSFSVRYCGSPSFSFNDYSCYFSDRFDRCPLLNSASLSSQCCSCCCSSSFFARPTVLYPGHLYGPRQSTLIQWAPYKRLILNSLDRCYASRFSVCDAARRCSCESYDYKERKLCGRKGKLGRGRYRCMVFEEESERHTLCGGSGGADEAEVLLSLLTEDVSDECFGVGERRAKSFRKIDVEKGRNGGGNGVRNRKKNVESGVLESVSKFQAKITRSRDEDRCKENTRKEDEREIVQRRNQRGRAKKEGERNRYGETSNETVREEERNFLLKENQRERIRDEEQGSLSRQEDHRRKIRKDGSSCSSYYSLSSAEFESDDEVQVNREEFRHESTSGYTKGSKRTGELPSDEVWEDFEKDGSKEYATVLSKKNNLVGFSGASSAVESDWRKKSEKQLTDVSVDKTQYRKESVQNLSTYGADKDRSYGKAFGSYSQSDDRSKLSTLSVNVDEKMREQNRQTSETGSRMKYKQFTETSDTNGADLETSSTSHKLHRSRDESPSKSTNSVRESKEHHVTAERIRREEEYRGSFGKYDEASEGQEVDIGATSNSRRRSEIRIKDKEDHWNRIQSSVHNRQEQHHQAVQASRILDSTMKHHKLTTDMNKESTSASQRESESRMRKQEANSSFVHNSHLETREHLQETTSKYVSILESRKGSQEVSETSFPSKSDVGLSNVDDGDKREVLMSPPPSQSAAAGSFLVESTSGLTIKEIANERLRSGPTETSRLRVEEIVDERLDSGTTAMHESTLDKSRRLHEDKGDESRGQHLKVVFPDDALGSADRLQKSSAHYVGEFVQKVKDEISSSEIYTAKDTYKAKLLSKEEQQSQASLGSYGSEVSQLKEQESRQSSQSSGAKGPSDEMWAVTEPTIQKPPETEVLIAESTTENAVAKRSSKSLWNIIADVVRFRWGSRSESRSSPSKSGGKNSPNQSTSSETWFSGHDQEESNDFNVQNDRISLTQGPLSIAQQQEGKIGSSQVSVSHSSSSRGETKHKEADASTSLIAHKDSSPKATSLPSKEACSETNPKATFAATEGADLSTPPPSIQEVGGVLATRRTEGSGSGTIVQLEPVPTVLSDKSSPGSISEELKRRKLQRVDQVQKDRFDEWEEAYRFENEQRKMDELFMREALLEAKKAADNWEVPVGAVLVHDGKIIARGYNLVEELRDSTAHAEMICIREASNILRTWRLSETTLYVTLEPCPMCAGAILQARIDTVVWGAPNKLLGADGSWIRLFPDSEGGSGLVSSEKPPAPVHPFHPKIVIRRGILSSECADMMQQFFQLRRKKKDKNKEEPPSPPSCLPISHHPSKFMTKMHDAFHFMFCL